MAILYLTRPSRHGAIGGLWCFLCQRAAADGDTAARYQESLHRRDDVHDLFARIRAPTLVIHCRDDEIVAFEEGRRIASLIPGAQLLPLPTGTRCSPGDEAITDRMAEAVARFTGSST